MDSKRPSLSILEKPAYYAVTIAFGFFLAVSATMLLSKSWAIYYNMAASVVLTYLAVEYLVRWNKNPPSSFFRVRYQAQVMLGMGSVLCIMMSFYDGDTALLAPLLFYRVYHDSCRALGTPLSRILDYSFLLVGVVATPLAVFVGNLPMESPLFVVYLAAGTSMILSLLKDHIENEGSRYCPMSEVTVKLNQEAMAITQGMVDSAMDHLRTDILSVPTHQRCSWHLTILNSLEYLDVLMEESVTRPDLAHFVKHLNGKSSRRIVFAGWDDHLESDKATVVMSLVKFFVGISEKSFKEDGDTSQTIWVTNTPGRVCVKDNTGGISEDTLTPKEKSFIETVSSDCFLSEYGVKVAVNGKANHGDGHGLDALIIFS